MRRLANTHHVDLAIKMPHKISTAMRDVFLEEILNNPEGLKLPERFGVLKIVKTQTGRILNYGLVRKNIRTSVINDHTDGYRMKMIWVKRLPLLYNTKLLPILKYMNFGLCDIGRETVFKSSKEWYKYETLISKISEDDS